MRERLDHMRHHEYRFVEVRVVPKLRSSGRNREPECTVKPGRKILCLIGSLRHLTKKRFIQLWILSMRVNHCFDHRAHEFVQRRPGVLHQGLLDQTIDFFDMPVMQSSKNCAFVWKVLIERADADPGYLGDSIGVHRLGAFALQDAHHGVKDRFDSLAGTGLFRLPS